MSIMPLLICRFCKMVGMHFTFLIWSLVRTISSLPFSITLRLDRTVLSDENNLLLIFPKDKTQYFSRSISLTSCKCFIAHCSLICYLLFPLVADSAFYFYFLFNHFECSTSFSLLQSALYLSFEQSSLSAIIFLGLFSISNCQYRKTLGNFSQNTEDEKEYFTFINGEYAMARLSYPWPWLMSQGLRPNK